MIVVDEFSGMMGVDPGYYPGLYVCMICMGHFLSLLALLVAALGGYSHLVVMFEPSICSCCLIAMLPQRRVLEEKMNSAAENFFCQEIIHPYRQAHKQ